MRMLQIGLLRNVSQFILLAKQSEIRGNYAQIQANSIARAYHRSAPVNLLVSSATSVKGHVIHFPFQSSLLTSLWFPLTSPNGADLSHQLPPLGSDQLWPHPRPCPRSCIVEITAINRFSQLSAAELNRQNRLRCCQKLGQDC